MKGENKERVGQEKAENRCEMKTMNEKSGGNNKWKKKNNSS